VILKNSNHFYQQAEVRFSNNILRVLLYLLMQLGIWVRLVFI